MTFLNCITEAEVDLGYLLNENVVVKVEKGNMMESDYVKKLLGTGTEGRFVTLCEKFLDKEFKVIDLVLDSDFSGDTWDYNKETNEIVNTTDHGSWCVVKLPKNETKEKRKNRIIYAHGSTSFTLTNCTVTDEAKNKIETLSCFCLTEKEIIPFVGKRFDQAVKRKKEAVNNAEILLKYEQERRKKFKKQGLNYLIR